jgi:hypothetical protein
MSLVDSSIAYPPATIDTGFFPNTPNTFDSWFWSSTPFAGNAVRAMYVHFAGGYVNDGGKGAAHQVRLVRAGQ